MRIRLTYFSDGKGRSELPRLCLKYAGGEFEDERIQYDEYKRRRGEGELPFGQLPTLQVDDTLLAQSCAISRWCGSHAGLIPQDPLQAASVDMVLDAWRDLLDEYYAVVFARKVVNGALVMTPTPKEGRRQAVADLFATTVKLYFTQFERMLGEGHHLVGDGLSLADLAMFDAASVLQSSRDPANWAEFMDSFPKITLAMQRTSSLPWMAAHLAQMPYMNSSQMLYA